MEVECDIGGLLETSERARQVETDWSTLPAKQIVCSRLLQSHRHRLNAELRPLSGGFLGNWLGEWGSRDRRFAFSGGMASSVWETSRGVARRPTCDPERCTA